MFIDPQADPPHRIMILGACRETWYAAEDQERQERALPALRELFDDWQEMGLKVLHSFDDDFFLVGQPGSLQFAFYIIAEAPSLESIVAMMNRARKTVGGLRADRYFRFETRMGRKLFLLDD